MKIAKVYMEGFEINMQDGAAVRNRMKHFLDPRFADEKTPFFLVEIPLRKAVLPVLLCVPVAPGVMRYHADVLDFSQPQEPGPSEVRGWEDHAGDLFPMGEWLRDPPKHYVALLNEARKHWLPLTSMSYAPKFLRFLYELTPEQRGEMLKCIGVKARKSFQKKLFLCLQWDEWARFEASPADRVAHMKQHGLEMSHDAIAKMAQRLGLDGGRRRE